MIRIDRKSGEPPRLTRQWHSLLLHLREKLIRHFEITEDESSFQLKCESPRELGRCYKFFLKEPGTCDWISNYVKAGDVFFDIGANIGVFTLLAAQKTGKTGKVFAFEPHSANFTRLIDNIIINNLQNIVMPCNFALNDVQGFFLFNYSSSDSGTSDSQLSSVRSFSGIYYQPQLSEMKYAASVDSLIASGNFPAPHHIKIDVDGNEGLILRGMQTLLASPERPRSIQVEVSKNNEADILGFLKDRHYAMVNRHFTRGAQRRIAKGANPEEFHYNAIFRPET